MPRPAKPALTDKEKERIVALFNGGGITQNALAERFGVTQNRISQIIADAKQSIQLT